MWIAQKYKKNAVYALLCEIDVLNMFLAPAVNH